MSDSPFSHTPDSLAAARARLDAARWTTRAAMGQLLSGRIADALAQLDDALDTLDGRAPGFGADEAALDSLLAACTVAAELARTPCNESLLPEAERLQARALRRRIAALRGSA